MSAEQAARVRDYLSRLTGRDIDDAEPVALSSGQRARFHAWSRHEAIVLDEDVLSRGRFCIADVLGAPAPERDVPAPQPADRERPPAAGIGIDIQLVGELVPESDDLKGEPELRGLFTLREIAYAETRPDPRATLAGLFAAKEAVMKLDAARLNRPLTEIEVLPDESGRPSCAGYVLSIAHSGEYAVAAAAKAAISAPPAERAPSLVARPRKPATSAEALPSRPSRKGPARRVLGGLYHLVLFSGAVSFVLLVVGRLLDVPILR